jgi:hypothetical protein
VLNDHSTVQVVLAGLEVINKPSQTKTDTTAIKPGLFQVFFCLNFGRKKWRFKHEKNIIHYGIFIDWMF